MIKTNVKDMRENEMQCKKKSVENAIFFYQKSSNYIKLLVLSK